MAKGKKSAKDLTDDWIKQVVTGQVHKLAHMNEGGSVKAVADALQPQGLADVSRAEKANGLDVTYPAAPAQPVIAQPVIAQPVLSQGQVTSNYNAEMDRNHQMNVQRKAEAAAFAAQPKPRQTSYGSAFANGGCVKRMEKGGEVDGPGTGTSDSVPAMLSDGEYVLPADTVAAVGKATLDKIKNATHTPVNKQQMRGMVVHLADGALVTQPDLGHYIRTSMSNNTPASTPLGEKLNAESVQGRISEIGTPNPSGFVPHLPTVYGPDQSSVPYSVTTGVGSSTNSNGLPAIAAPVITAPAPTSTATTGWDEVPMTQTAPAAAPATAKPISAPNFMPTMSGPNTAQDMVSEGRNLMDTQGIGGFVQAKGLNRMAETVNQTNEPLVRGQYELQNTAMTANERLEQAKLVEHQRQQNLETWTPDKNMMGELLGYGRTKGGTPEYVTKESLMSKPTLAQYIAKNSLVNPKATTAEHTAQYNARYGQ